MYKQQIDMNHSTSALIDELQVNKYTCIFLIEEACALIK